MTRRPMNADADTPPTRSDSDGIRWELVDRMKALIAADELDTPDRWAIAEELLFRAADEGK